MGFEKFIRDSGFSDILQYIEDNKKNKKLLDVLLKDANILLNKRKEELEYSFPELGGEYAEKAKVTWEDIEKLEYLISIITPELQPPITPNTETVTESQQITKDQSTTKRQENKESQQITIPDHILKSLQETICSNGKAFIKDAKAEPLKWLQNKQLLREFLMYEKIKGELEKKEVEDLTPTLFIDKNGIPYKLAKPKKKDDDPNHKRLMKILATL